MFMRPRKASCYVQLSLNSLETLRTKDSSFNDCKPVKDPEQDRTTKDKQFKLSVETLTSLHQTTWSVFLLIEDTRIISLL